MQYPSRGDTPRDKNIRLVESVLANAGIVFSISPTGREIIFGQKKIKINHNGQKHWTIRVPGAAKDGIRLKFGADLAVADGLFIIGDSLAIKYD